MSLFTVATVIASLLAAFMLMFKLTVQGKNIGNDDFSFSINGSLRINHLLKLPNNRSIRVIKHLSSVNHSVLNEYLLYLLLERILKGIPSTFYKAAKIDGAVIWEYIHVFLIANVNSIGNSRDLTFIKAEFIPIANYWLQTRKNSVY